ncbi:MAG: hypothetical protein QXK37_02900 [Candidatus Woesearchaeota archaeon]
MPKKERWRLYHHEHEIFETLKATFDYLEQKHGLSKEEILDLAYNNDYHLKIPIKIFSGELCPLEAVVSFLREAYNLSFHEIAVLLGRNDRTIWATYKNSLNKKTRVSETGVSYSISNEYSGNAYFIPVMILNERGPSILELVVEFLHETSQLSIKDIAALLCRSESTIRTAYWRIKRKRHNEK